MNVVCAFVCRDAFHGIEDKWSVSDICDFIVVDRLPEMVESLVYFVLIELDGEEKEKTFQATYTLRNPKREIMDQVRDLELKVRRFPAHGRIAIRVNFNFEVSRPGVFTHELILNGLLICRSKMRVYIRGNVPDDAPG